MTNRLQSSLGEAQNATGITSQRVPTIEAGQLLGEAGVLAIVHGGETYRLTRTKQNKLLLTKCPGYLVSECVQQDQ